MARCARGVVGIGVVGRSPHGRDQVPVVTRRPGIRTRYSTIAHSVGVRCATSPSPTRRLATDRHGSRGSDDWLIPCRRSLSRRTPALVPATRHPKRLGDVVVGTGIERLRPWRLVVADGQHDDRHVRPAPKCFDHHEPSSPGSPRSSNTTSGVAQRRFESLPRRVGLFHLVAAAPRSGRAPDGSAARRRRPGCGLIQHARRPYEIVIVSPPFGVSSKRSTPPMISTNPRAIASPSPAPRRSTVAGPLERNVHPVPVGFGASRAVIDDAHVHPVATRCRGHQPLPSPRGRPGDRVGHQVRDRPLEEGGIGQHQRQPFVDLDDHVLIRRGDACQGGSDDVLERRRARAGV